jgi:hypothetical protein
MELRVIDFEVLTRNFQPYVDGYKNIESEKRKMLESIEPSRKEMQEIIKRSQSGLIVDELSQKRDMDKFKQLQESLMKADTDFKTQLKEMSEELIMNDLNILNEFLLTHKFNKLIDFHCLSKTAVRHILWCLSKKIEGTHERLYELLEKYSPSKFGYEHGFKYLTLG